MNHYRRRYRRMLDRTNFPSGKVIFTLWILWAILMALIVSGAFTPTEAQAKPTGKVHHSIPVRVVRLGAGTVETMVWPRHHWKEWAFMDANLLANMWDARATDMLFKECVGCAETNPVLGPHPGPGALYSFKIGTAFFENMVTKGLAEKAKEEHYPVVLAFVPAGILGGLSIWAGDYAYGKDGYLLWRDCNRNPGCFPHRTSPQGGATNGNWSWNGNATLSVTQNGARAQNRKR